MFTKIIDPIIKVKERLLVVVGSSNEHMLNNFAFGTRIGLHVVSGNVKAFNLATDNVGEYGIEVDSGNVTVCNYMRYNGATSTGTVTLFNAININ